jgi:hypothetical protein
VLEGFQFQRQGGEGETEIGGINVDDGSAANVWSEKSVGRGDLIGRDHGTLFREVVA